MSKLVKYLVPILLIIIAISVFYIYQSSRRGLVLELKTPDKISIGVPFDLRVEFSNQSETILKNVSLSVNLPEGAVFVGEGENKTLVIKELGNIGKDSLVSETYQAIFLRGQDGAKKIRATINYSPSSLGARFEKSKEIEVAVQGGGVAVEMIGPESVFSGEEFELEVVYRNVSEMDFTNLELKLEYPANFTFLSSTLEPDKGKDTWILGDLRKGSEGTFTITGSVIGPEDSRVEFKPVVRTTLAGRNYDLEIPPFGLTIAHSPLSLVITLNNAADYVSRLNDNLDYVISYVNNADVALRGVVIRAQLVGEMFDFNYLNTDGLFRSSDNTLIWNSQNTPNLNVLQPKSAGFVKFTIKAKNNYPIRRFSDKNFTLKVNAEIESPTVPSSVVAAKTFNVARSETKVSGTIIVEAPGYFRDALAGILNKGAMPPRVGQPTNFTIHWRLKNFANDASAIELRAQLREGVKFTGVVKGNLESLPRYDESNNQMIWQIDKLAANRGVIDQLPEAIFQIEAVPTSDLVGKYMPLIGPTTIKFVDDFTGLESTSMSAPISTALPDDATVGSQGGVVQP